MRILFFSDAHGNQYSVRELFTKLPFEKPDLTVFGGDIFGYYYGQTEIIEMLRREGCTCLLGNHDRFFLDLIDGKIREDYLVDRYGSSYKDVESRFCRDDICFLRSLRSRFDLVADGLRLSFVHGSITDPLNGRIYPDTQIADLEPYSEVDFVFMGHTHHKLTATLPNGTVLLNPGSIGQQRDGKGCTYGVFDTETKEWMIKEVLFDKEQLIMEIRQHHETEEMERRLTEVLFRERRKHT